MMKEEVVEVPMVVEVVQVVEVPSVVEVSQVMTVEEPVIKVPTPVQPKVVAAAQPELTYHEGQSAFAKKSPIAST